ncbi:MAG: MBL fold metallo-hydrolase [Deltaproteobacteria bacterium]|nr:MBL fold metallo-hydrolase [Deltaproteobacteria bacterium]
MMTLPGGWRRGLCLALLLTSVPAIACSGPTVAPTPRPVAPGAPASAAASAPAVPSSLPVVAARAPASSVGAPAEPPAVAGLRAYWVGHATVLVAMGDKWIITDPNFSDRVGLLARRKVTPGIDLAAIPPVSWILVSHGHFDHLDKRSLKRLSPTAAVATPPGVARFVPKGRFKEVVSLGEWQSVERDGVRVTAVPVKHGDGRYGVDGAFRRGSHTGFVVEYQGLALFFAGDTAYHDRHFKEIGRRFRVDVALVPIGPVGIAPVRGIMRTRHADPADALRILEDVGARWMIPIHHGTFFTGGRRELDALEVAVRKRPVGNRVKLLQPGEAFTLPGAAGAPPSRPAVYQ